MRNTGVLKKYENLKNYKNKNCSELPQKINLNDDDDEKKIKKRQLKNQIIDMKPMDNSQN